MAKMGAGGSAHPPGTTFLLTDGVYRLQGRTDAAGNVLGLAPKSNQTLQAINPRRAVLSGARQIDYTTAVRAPDGLWEVSGFSGADNTTGDGACESGYEACTLRQDLFLNNEPLHRVLSRGNVSCTLFRNGVNEDGACIASTSLSASSTAAASVCSSALAMMSVASTCKTKSSRFVTHATQPLFISVLTHQPPNRTTCGHLQQQLLHTVHAPAPPASCQPPLPFSWRRWTHRDPEPRR